jgi:hypothetical protein
MRLAAKNGADLYFNEKCVDANLEQASVIFENTNTNQSKLSHLI